MSDRRQEYRTAEKTEEELATLLALDPGDSRQQAATAELRLREYRSALAHGERQSIAAERSAAANERSADADERQAVAAEGAEQAAKTSARATWRSAHATVLYVALTLGLLVIAVLVFLRGVK